MNIILENISTERCYLEMRIVIWMVGLVVVPASENLQILSGSETDDPHKLNRQQA